MPFALLASHHSRQRQLIVFVDGLRNDPGTIQVVANWVLTDEAFTMARDEHNMAVELRENVAKAHRPAKEHEQANTAEQHSQTVHQHSDQAHSKSQQQK
jgi:hypothetical protein